MVERLTATASTKTRRWIVPLHSSVSSAEQRQAFSKPPHGVRKIVIATNIAETSLTIADVCFVIDAGRLKVGLLFPVSFVQATDLSRLVVDNVPCFSITQDNHCGGFCEKISNAFPRNVEQCMRPY